MELPANWARCLDPYLNLDDFYRGLHSFTYRFGRIIPDSGRIFNAFEQTPPSRVRCVLYGEDPYPRPTSANGIAFWDAEIKSWNERSNGNAMKNILKALCVAADLATYHTPISECRKIAHQNKLPSPPELFRSWIDQGVLLINAALTYSNHSDKQQHLRFWRPFHHAVIEALNARASSPFYVLWGGKAKRWLPHIEQSIDDRSKILTFDHPTFIHQFLDPSTPDYSPFTAMQKYVPVRWLSMLRS